MAAKPLPPAEYLRQCFDYDPNAGILTWRERPRDHFATDRGWRTFNGGAHWKAAGQVLLRRDGAGSCISVSINSQRYLAHRIIWAMVYGTEPTNLIDHRDGDGLNNRISNLREATHAQNMMNKRRLKPGLKGAYWCNRRSKWVCQITHEGRRICVGRFDSREEAHAAYCKKAHELFGEFARPA